MRSLCVICLGATLAAGACAPVPDSGNPVYLEAVSPTARAVRDAELERSAANGRGPDDSAPADPAAAEAQIAPGTLTDDSTYRPDPSAAAGGTAAAGPYEVAQPEPVPERPEADEPSVVQYALSTSNPVGTPQYQRSYVSEARTQRACARYASADQAQTAFLDSGGPQQDTQGLDPDGDGYACSWDPAPFREAVDRG